MGCSECGMLEMWDVQDVGYWGCGMVRMWDVRDVGCLGYWIFKLRDVWDVGCSGYGMFEMWDIRDVSYSGCESSRCGMFGIGIPGISNVRNGEYSKYGMFARMGDVVLQNGLNTCAANLVFITAYVYLVLDEYVHAWYGNRLCKQMLIYEQVFCLILSPKVYKRVLEYKISNLKINMRKRGERILEMVDVIIHGRIYFL